MKRSWITLFVLIFSSFFASQVQSSFGKVSVQSIKIPTQNGQWLVADLFKPITATSKNPAPAVIVVPGFQRSKETLSNVSIELSRRGIVVFNIDPYAHKEVQVHHLVEELRQRKGMVCLRSLNICIILLILIM